MKTTAKHRCTHCSKTFKTAREFEAHECVTKLNGMTLDELMACYNASKGTSK